MIIVEAGTSFHHDHDYDPTLAQHNFYTDLSCSRTALLNFEAFLILIVFMSLTLMYDSIVYGLLTHVEICLKTKRLNLPILENLKLHQFV